MGLQFGISSEWARWMCSNFEPIKRDKTFGLNHILIATCLNHLGAPFQMQQSSTTTKERLLKPKYITYRKQKLSTTTKQVSKSLLNTSSSAAQKGIHGLAKHQSETNKTNHRCAASLSKNPGEAKLSNFLAWSWLACSQFRYSVSFKTTIERFSSSGL